MESSGYVSASYLDDFLAGEYDDVSTTTSTSCSGHGVWSTTSTTTGCDDLEDEGGEVDFEEETCSGDGEEDSDVLAGGIGEWNSSANDQVSVSELRMARTVARLVLVEISARLRTMGATMRSRSRSRSPRRMERLRGALRGFDADGVPNYLDLGGDFVWVVVPGEDDVQTSAPQGRVGNASGVAQELETTHGESAVEVDQLPDMPLGDNHAELQPENVALNEMTEPVMPAEQDVPEEHEDDPFALLSPVEACSPEVDDVVEDGEQDVEVEYALLQNWEEFQERQGGRVPLPSFIPHALHGCFVPNLVPTYEQIQEAWNKCPTSL
ncbi:unnamed protein product [Symbiodinium sp. CCMP2592]|nr:unnamed protein product [Symbiodinium sp. CCMP2592]